MSSKKPIVVTIYIPLCAETCTFCSRLTCPSTLTMVNRYSNALWAEIDAVALDLTEYEIAAVRFTGGTPLLLGGTNVANTLNRLRKHLPFTPDCEITVETVIDKIDEYNFHQFAQIGVNRLEIFVPTFVGDEHRRLAAPGVNGHFSLIDTMRRCLGPENWGLHLLCGFEGQTEETWGRTLEKAAGFQPSSLRLEAFPRSAKPQAGQTDDGLEKVNDSSRTTQPASNEIADHTPALHQLRKQAETYLLSQGYKPAALDYFARPSAQPQWATLIAEGADQLGIGAGAASRWGGFWYCNTSDINHYISHAADPEQVIIEAGSCK